MNKPDHPPEDHISTGEVSGRMFRLAVAAVIWERLWPKIWWVLVIGLTFLSVALFDVLPDLPAVVHGLILIAFGAALLTAVIHLLRTNVRVSKQQLFTRVEHDSNLHHRPLSGLDDQPAKPLVTIFEQRLWQAHRRRLSDRLKQLHVRLPSPAMAQKDPVAFRMALILVTAVSVGTGWADMTPRISRALHPYQAAGMLAHLELEVWVTPPAYSGRAPVFLNFSGASPQHHATPATPIDIPVGSTILAQVTGGSEVPELVLAERRIRLPAIGNDASEGGFRGTTNIVSADLGGNSLQIFSGGTLLADWPVRIADDHPPEIEFVDPPRRVGQASLLLHFAAQDDFALKNVWANIRRSGMRGQPSTNQIRVELPATGLGTTRVKGQSRHDYSAHPWAGTRVQIELVAEDAKGQLGKSKPFTMILPARTFNHPVARSLVEQRRKLNDGQDDVIGKVIRTLDQIRTRPALFFDDTTVFLGISVARSRLQQQRENAAVPSVQKLLWNLALRIEDGEFAIADRELKDVQERLEAALRSGQSPEKLDQILADLQAALDKYMAALADHLQREGTSAMPLNPAARLVDRGDLQRIIEQTRDLTKTGSLEAAREMLAQLGKMLDSIRDGARQSPANGQMKSARKAMDDLRNLARQQQNLLDKTFREMQNRGGSEEPLPLPGQPKPQNGDGRPPGETTGGDTSDGSGDDGPPQRSFSELSGRQQDLRRELGRVTLQMDKTFGAVPDGLGKADQAMKGAGTSLGSGNEKDAIDFQTEALDHLRQATSQAAEQIARQMQGQTGLTPGLPGQGRGRGLDPFGRPGGGRGSLADDGGVKVPSERDILRAREIFDELRRRAGEQVRPREERDYIDRLLRRF